MASLTAARTGTGARAPHVELSALACTALLAILALCVVYPIVLVILQSFQVSDPAQPTVWGLDGWRAALSEPSLRTSLLNTVVLTLTRQAITLPIAVAIAWLLARTDVPFGRWIEFAFWTAFFLPPLTSAMVWILLADPHYGLLNQLLGTLLHSPQGPFNVYSFWGIVWVDTVTTALTIKVILLTPAFRYMNSTFEEASQIAGAGSLRTALRITVPIMTPVILVVTILGTLAALQGFEIEQVLGIPFRFFVFSTMIYNLVEASRPSYASASALAMFVLVVMLPLIALQFSITRRRRYTTVTGQFKSQVASLGRWRWPIFALLGLVLVVVLGVPVVFSFLATLMKVFGFFTIPDPWTLGNWDKAFKDPFFIGALRNTLTLAIGTAVVAMVLYSVLAYVAIRSRYRFRRMLDFVTWLPVSVPGLIFGLALLWVFLGVPIFRPLYGTVGMLILAGVITGMPLGVQIIKSSLQQLGTDLEEASRISGGSWFATYRRVVLPLLGPALLTVGLIVFVGSARNISHVALLATSSNQPLSILQLNYIAEGRNEVAAVISFIVMLASVGGALLARAAGFRGASL
jgi:iron(III) transport system permease protein